MLRSSDIFFSTIIKFHGLSMQTESFTPRVCFMFLNVMIFHWFRWKKLAFRNMKYSLSGNLPTKNRFFFGPQQRHWFLTGTF